MPDLIRSATLSIGKGFDIELPMSPAIEVTGRRDNKSVCQMEISATGILIKGPKGKLVRKYNWDELLEAAYSN